MIMNNSPQIYVSVDIGCRQHSVAIGLSNGDVLDEFAILHRPEGFKQFSKHQQAKICFILSLEFLEGLISNRFHVYYQGRLRREKADSVVKRVDCPIAIHSYELNAL